MGRLVKDLTGQTFGALRVLHQCPVPKGKRKGIWWLCRCLHCRREKAFIASNIRRPERSCGCLQRIFIAKALTAHGDSYKVPEYEAWCGMRRRCRDLKKPKHKHWFGRGIRVCSKWDKSYVSFLADVGRRPGPEYSLDRIRRNEGYKPGNVRWATAKTQQNNRTNNRRFRYAGHTRTLSEWADWIGIDQDTLGARLLRGWSFREALLRPLRQRGG